MLQHVWLASITSKENALLCGGLTQPELHIKLMGKVKFRQRFTKTLFNKKWLIPCQMHLHRANSFIFFIDTSQTLYHEVESMCCCLLWPHICPGKKKGTKFSNCCFVCLHLFEVKCFLSKTWPKTIFICHAQAKWCCFLHFCAIVKPGTTSVFWERVTESRRLFTSLFNPTCARKTSPMFQFCITCSFSIGLLVASW